MMRREVLRQKCTFLRNGGVFTWLPKWGGELAHGGAILLAHLLVSSFACLFTSFSSNLNQLNSIQANGMYT